MPSHRLLLPKYRPDIDGLRAIAVLSVVAYHAYPVSVKGGFIGVDIFFVISGFLISTIILENLAKGTFRFAEFYARRIRRIFPALIVVLVASWCVGLLILLPDEYDELGRHIAAGSVFGSNFQLWSEAGYFDRAARLKPLLHLWSLGIEEQFYIVWPLLLWLARRRTVRLILMAGLVGASFYLNVRSITADAVATFYSPATRFWELGCGGVLAWWTLYGQHARASLSGDGGVTARLAGMLARHRAIVANSASVAGAALLIYGFARINVAVGFPGLWALVPVLGAVLTIAAGPGAWLNRHVLSHPVAVWFGLISYPLYLWHWPVLSFVEMTFSPVKDVMVAVLVVLAVVLAWLTYRFIETPVRLGGRGVVAVTSTLAVCLGGIGVLGYATHAGEGLPWSWRASHAGVEGDTTNEGFYRYMAAHYHTCSLEALAREAPRFKGVVQCMQSKADAPVDVAIIGDSHAEALFPGLAEAVPSLNVAYYVPGGHDGIDGIYGHVLKTASIKYVVLSMFWRGRLEMPEGSSQYRGMLPVIDAFTRAGKTVYVTDDVPSFPFDVDTCKRYRWFDWKRCEVGSDADFRRYGSELAALAQAVQGRADVRVLAIRGYFCDALVCSMIRDGRFWYRDSNHINIEASLTVGRQLVADNKGVFAR